MQMGTEDQKQERWTDVWEADRTPVTEPDMRPSPQNTARATEDQASTALVALERTLDSSDSIVSDCGLCSSAELVDSL